MPMPTPLPLVTRREIVREYRPDDTVTVDSGIRALRAKSALSAGLSFVARGAGGELGGRVHLYSALNRDAARAARRGDLHSADRISKAASRLEKSPEATQLINALSKRSAGGLTENVGAIVVGAAALAAGTAVPAGAPGIAGAAGLAQALSTPALTDYVAKLQRSMARARKELNLGNVPTILNGRISAVDESVGLLKLHGSLAVTVPRAMLDDAGVYEVGNAVSAMWELLPGGRTLLTVEPAVEAPETNELGEPLVDIHGTPWGSVLSQGDADALRVTGEPTISIPAGVPDVE
jgi:hypothetical protein